ncbi:MAG: hypothetical protein KAT77_02755 [Nanoarchaeota archaeon]|nr:hypothetical protein [Nanoarchaeota archaeon]
MIEKERFKELDLAEFLLTEDNEHYELLGAIHGLTEHQLPDGNIAYAGVIADGIAAIPFRGGPGIANADLSLEKQVIRSTDILSVLRYSEKTGKRIFLKVFTSPSDIKGQDPALVTGAYVNPAPEKKD